MKLKNRVKYIAWKFKCQVKARINETKEQGKIYRMEI